MTKATVGRRSIDLTGQQFGRWTVLYATRRDSHRLMIWRCRCECGTEKDVRGSTLRSGRTNSCGCLHRERLSERWQGNTVADGNKNALKHGLTKSVEYKTWIRMKNRCFNTNDKDYPEWGGRGITVCDEWINDFPAFLNHLGPRPGPKYSVDRIDNDGNYEPGNVRWATPDQQANNRRPHRRKVV